MKKIFICLAAAVMVMVSGAFTACRGETAAPVKETPLRKIDPMKFHIPESFGAIKERHQGTSGKFIFYIQDAHCNYEAQSNNAKILEELVKNYGLKLVAVEGSTGLIDTTPFAQFPDKDIKNEVATYFMKKGRITGPEFLSITSNLRFTIYGIEDENAYKDNYDAFVKTVNLKDPINNALSALSRNFTVLKQNIFSPELRELDSRTEDFRNGKLQFMDYIALLNSKAKEKGLNIINYPNIDIQNKSKALEDKTDFKKVDQERGALIDELSKHMGKKELSELVAKSITFRAGKISAEDYYSFLQGLAAAAKVDFSKYKDLSNYTDYIKLLGKIKTSDLIVECDKLYEDVKEKMFTNDDERAIDKGLKNLITLGSLFDLKLAPAEHEYFEKSRSSLSTANLLKTLDKFKDRYGLTLPDQKDLAIIDDNIPMAEHFYTVANERNTILVKNTTAKMNEDTVDRAVLVTGGFHTDGIANILRDKGFSYIIITPRITNPNAENYYLDVMLNKKTPFEELLTSSESAK